MHAPSSFLGLTERKQCDTKKRVARHTLCMQGIIRLDSSRFASANRGRPFVLLSAGGKLNDVHPVLAAARLDLDSPLTPTLSWVRARVSKLHSKRVRGAAATCVAFAFPRTFPPLLPSFLSEALRESCSPGHGVLRQRSAMVLYEQDGVVYHMRRTGQMKVLRDPASRTSSHKPFVFLTRSRQATPFATRSAHPCL